jgi:hypothetical protein
MTRRRLLLALPVVQQLAGQLQDLEALKWQALADAWNPFAAKLNRGIFDAPLWAKVLKQIHAIEGKPFCKEKK